MKKTLLLGMLMLAGINASAQLAPGSDAPDFTATDINGNTHTLSEYLAQGKTVILDISATWCGPCWQFHSAHVLSDLYYTYGPGGTNELVVLFVEGDPTTSVNSIYGTNVPTDNPNYPTQGNWANGTPYPIIDSGAIGDLYQTNYFPTLYRICPDGKVTEMDPAAPTTLISELNSNCGQMIAPQNNAEIKPYNARVCQAEGVLQAEVKNYGSNAITSATIVIKENGTVIATENFTGNVAPFTKFDVEFADVTFNAEADYTVEISNINSATPLTSWMAEREFEVAFSDQISNNIVVNVYTDLYPGEISWKIKNSAGAVVYTAGPYQAGPQSSGGAGGPDANTTKTHFVTLPDGIDCYSFELLDSYGDGWSWGSATHGIEVFTSAGSALFIGVGEFGSSLDIQSAFSTMGALGSEDFASEKFSIYPNPSNGVFNFATPETVSVIVSDITGKTVFTANNINNGGSIDLSALQSGIYIAKINGATSERIEKLVIK